MSAFLEESELRELVRQDLITNSRHVFTIRHGIINEAQIGVDDFVELSVGKCEIQLDRETRDLIEWIGENGVHGLSQALRAAFDKLGDTEIAASARAKMDGFLTGVKPAGRARSWNIALGYKKGDRKQIQSEIKTWMNSEEFKDSRKPIKKYYFAKTKEIIAILNKAQTIEYNNINDLKKDSSDNPLKKHYPGVYEAFKKGNSWCKSRQADRMNQWSPLENQQLVNFLNTHHEKSYFRPTYESIVNEPVDPSEIDRDKEQQIDNKKRAIGDKFLRIAETIVFFANEYLTAAGAPSIICIALSKMLKYLSTFFNSTVKPLADNLMDDLAKSAKEADIDKEQYEKEKRKRQLQNDELVGDDGDKEERDNKKEGGNFDFSKEVTQGAKAAATKALKKHKKLLDDNKVGLNSLNRTKRDWRSLAFFFPHFLDKFVYEGTMYDATDSIKFLQTGGKDLKLVKNLFDYVRGISDESAAKSLYSDLINKINNDKTDRFGAEVEQNNANKTACNDNEEFKGAAFKKNVMKALKSEIKKAPNVLNELYKELREYHDRVDDITILANAVTEMRKVITDFT